MASIYSKVFSISIVDIPNPLGFYFLARYKQKSLCFAIKNKAEVIKSHKPSKRDFSFLDFENSYWRRLPGVAFLSFHFPYGSGTYFIALPFSSSDRPELVSFLEQQITVKLWQGDGRICCFVQVCRLKYLYCPDYRTDFCLSS